MAMDPADELFEALATRDADPRPFERAIGGVQHLLERGARATAARNQGLLEGARIDLDDLVQELAHKLFRSPPTARGRAEAVIVGWAKVAARNHLVDLTRKRKPETSLEDLEPLADPPDADRAFDARAAVRQLERCADELRDRYRAAYDLLREDSEMPRLEIALRLGMVSEEDASRVAEGVDPKSPLGDRIRKAQANAWAVVARVRSKLADCLDRHGMLALLPDTLTKLRRKTRSRS